MLVLRSAPNSHLYNYTPPTCISTKLEDRIFITACRIPAAPPGSCGDCTGLTGAIDTATATNLMCVSRRHYNLLLPLLYRAPLIRYNWQITAFYVTLVSNPALAPLVEHLYIDTGNEFLQRPFTTCAPFDYESMFSVAPHGTTFPLHYAIEYDAVEIFNATNREDYDLRHPQYPVAGSRQMASWWMDGLFEYRTFIAWLRYVAAHGARDTVSPSDVTCLEARAPEAARRLAAAYRLAADEMIKYIPGNACVINQLRMTPDAPGTRSEPFGPPRPDICAEEPALYALQLDAYLSIGSRVRRWLRLIAARALAYGRLNGAKNAQAYKEYRSGNKRWLWDRGEAPEPCNFPYDDDLAKWQIYTRPRYIPFGEWYLIMPGKRISPAPVRKQNYMALHGILNMTTSVRTLACRAFYLTNPAVFNALPRLEKLVSPTMSFIVTLTPYRMPIAAEGSLVRVRDITSRKEGETPEEWYQVTRRGNVLGNVEQLTLCYSDAYVRTDRSMLDSLTLVNVDGSLLRVTLTTPLAMGDPLVHAFGLVPTLTESDKAALGVLGAHVPDKSIDECADLMLFLEYLRAAANHPLK